MKALADRKEVLKFYRGKRVLVTGNTGFKGSWLTFMLKEAGSIVMGYSLPPEPGRSLYEMAGLNGKGRIEQVFGDVRDLKGMEKAFLDFKPEIVFHLAAQPIVRRSYREPVETFETNIMGTVNVLECVRLNPSVRSFLNVTTDKVYLNREGNTGFKETDPLDGYDPYSNSKSCSELVTHSYASSFFEDSDTAISTARAGNVIGGGDFSEDRIIPDCVRCVEKAYLEGTGYEADITVRNPHSIRPYQHVLEPLFAYLMIAKAQYEDKDYSGWYNVGPDDEDCINTGDLVSCFCEKWNHAGKGMPRAVWHHRTESSAPHEAGYLKLDCSKLKSVFGWRPCWNTEKAIEETVNFTNCMLAGDDIRKEMKREIEEMENGCE